MKRFTLSLVLLSSTLLFSCSKPSTSKEPSKVAVSADTVQDFTKVSSAPWRTVQAEKIMVKDAKGNKVYFQQILPKPTGKPSPCVVLIHGSGSRKEWDWVDSCEMHGDSLVSLLIAKGIGVIAVDLAYHGDHYLADTNFTETQLDSIFENHWDSFFSSTLESFEPVFAYMKKNPQIDTTRVGVGSYSMGGLFAFRLANANPLFKLMVTMVPPNGREENDQYSPSNNQDNLADKPVMIIAAENDEWIPFKDTQWMKDQLKLNTLTFLSYKSGHTLPFDYVTKASEFIGNNI